MLLMIIIIIIIYSSRNIILHLSLKNQNQNQKYEKLIIHKLLYNKMHVTRKIKKNKVKKKGPLSS